MADHLPRVPEHDELVVAEKLLASDRPYVTLKAGATLDGKIATRGGESQWITGEASRALGHLLRAHHDAVLIGINTVLRDDPQLTARFPEQVYHPTRIVLDSTCRTPPQARVLAEDGAARFVIAGSDAPAERAEALRAQGVTVWQAPGARPQPSEFLPWLRAQGVRSVLVEGGAGVHGAFVANGEADALFLFLAGRLIGDSGAPSWSGALDVPSLAETPRLRLSTPRIVGGDVLVHGRFFHAER